MRCTPRSWRRRESSQKSSWPPHNERWRCSSLCWSTRGREEEGGRSRKGGESTICSEIAKGDTRGRRGNGNALSLCCGLVCARLRLLTRAITAHSTRARARSFYRPTATMMHSVISQHLLATELAQLERRLAAFALPVGVAESSMRDGLRRNHQQTLADCEQLEATLQAVRGEHTAADAALQEALQTGDELLREASTQLFLAQHELAGREAAAKVCSAGAGRARRKQDAAAPAASTAPSSATPAAPAALPPDAAAHAAALAAANAAAVQAAATTHDQGAAAEPHSLQLYEPSFGLHEDGVSSTNGLNGGLVDRSFDAAAIRATAASMASAAPPLSPSSRTPALDELAQVVDGMANGGSLCTSAYAAQAAMNVGQTRALAGALAAAIEASSSLEQHLPMRSPAASSSSALPPQQPPPSLPTPSSSLQSKQPPPTKATAQLATRSKSFERQSCSSGNGGGRGPSSARTSSLAQPRKTRPGFSSSSPRLGGPWAGSKPAASCAGGWALGGGACGLQAAAAAAAASQGGAAAAAWAA